MRALCWAYRAFLLGYAPAERRMTEIFYPEEKYAALMARLPQEHARPAGIILLAEKNGSPIGCGMSHALTPTECEIKRVFVTDAARRFGAGRALCTALIEQARNDGFRTLLLDTSKSFAPARALYETLGFHQRGPYQPLPDIQDDVVVFYEMDLAPSQITNTH